MRNLNLKHFLYILIPISIFVFLLVILRLPPEELAWIIFVRAVSTVITVDTVLVALFTKWLWRMRVFQKWLVPFPDLNGTFEGKIRSTWCDPMTKQTPGDIEAILTINQSFLRISCVMRTEEMTSHCEFADFVLDPDNQVCRLVCVYSSVPEMTVVERSPIHQGTVDFEIDTSKKKTKLTGNYWTGRKTTGTIEMEFLTKKKLSKFPKKKRGTHPVRAIRDFGNTVN